MSIELPPREAVLRWYLCERKVRYETWDEARAVMRDWNEPSLHAANPPTPFPCDICNGYHLGQTGIRSSPSSRQTWQNARSKYRQRLKKAQIAAWDAEFAEHLRGLDEATP